MSMIIYGILGIIVLAVLFLIGIILIVRGFMKKFLAEYANSKKPKVMIITGIVFVLLPVVAFVVLTLWSIMSSVTTVYNRAHYECVPDIWRHESVERSQAESDITTALLTSADRGDRKAFAMNFTPEIQRSAGFDAAVEDFFELYVLYSDGLSHCERKDNAIDESGSDNTGTKVLTDSLRFRCLSENKWYFVIIKYCYSNPGNPDRVGVTEFRVMNFEAAAVYDSYAGDEDYGKGEYLVCDIKSSDEVNARLIGGRPYVWEESSKKTVITSEKLRSLLRNGGRLDDSTFHLFLGEPGVRIKNPYSTEFGYFYELADEGDEPTYVYFQTDSEYGEILWSYICTPETIDYSNPVVANNSDR